jgi:hypothetical protein
MVNAMENGAYRGMRIEAQRVVRTLDRKQTGLIGLGFGSAYVLGALSVLALLISGTINFERSRDIPGMVCQDQSGGRVCVIWVTPPPKR